jgi:predicted TIM-barrel fold metal-dependent hydrolase
MYRPNGPAALRPIGETEFVHAIADACKGPTRIAAGIVGYADLTLGADVVPVLQAHMEAGGGRFKGIRHAASWDASDAVGNAHTHPPAGLLLDSTFRKGFACLDRFGLSFDAWIYHPQIKELIDLANAFPKTPIVLDHVGTPLGIGPYAGQRDEVLGEWRRDISLLAACGNVFVKLGGLAMKLNGFGWHKRLLPPTSLELAAAMTPYIHHCIACFGVQRCMFESNFPVDKPSCAYTVLWNAFKRMTEKFSDQERAALFHDTAAKVYRI